MQNQASTSEVQLSEKPAVAELCFLDRTRGKSVTRQMQSKGHGTKGAAESLLGTALSSERYGEESGSSKLQQSTSVKRSQGHTLKKSDNRLQNGVMNTVAPAQAALKSLTTDGPGFYGEISGPANLMPSLLPEFLRRISQNTQNAGASVTPDMSAKDSESLSSLPSKSKKMSTHRRNSHLDQTQRPLNSPVPDAFCSDYENISSSHYSRGTSPLHSTTNPRDVAGGKGAMASVRIRLSLEPRWQQISRLPSLVQRKDELTKFPKSVHILHCQTCIQTPMWAALQGGFYTALGCCWGGAVNWGGWPLAHSGYHDQSVAAIISTCRTAPARASGILWINPHFSNHICMTREPPCRRNRL